MNHQEQWQSRMLIQLLKACGHLLKYLPPRVLEIFSLLGGIILWDILRIRRKVCLDNITTMVEYCRNHPDIHRFYIPEEFRDLSRRSRSAIGRRSAVSLLLSLTECLIEWVKPGRSVVIFHNIEHFTPGSFLLCSHMANWEILGAAIAKNIRPVRTVVKEAGTLTLTETLRTFRKDIGFLAIEKNKDIVAVRQIFRALNHKESVGFVMDQFRPGDHIVPLFGKKTRTNSTLSRLHFQTSAPIVPVWMRRSRLFVFDAYFSPALPTVAETSNKEERVAQQTLEINRILEHMICLNPDQYFWHHRRFKM